MLLMAGAGLHAAPVTIDLPPQITTYGGSVRGYWFTAPLNFTITGLFVPLDASTDNQSIEVVRFAALPPPAYPGTTNDFVSLFRVVDDPSATFIPVSIPVGAGDVIGILGWRGTTNSYGQGDYTTTIGGVPVVLTRMGMQYDLNSTPAQNLWQEPGYSISRVYFQYDEVSGGEIPEPGTFGLAALSLALGFAAHRRVR